MRLAACLGVGLDIIEPCGFVLSDKRLKRAGMDYLGRADVQRHTSWEVFWQAFQAAQNGGRLILLTTQGGDLYTDFTYQASDILMVGRESAGVPEDVHAAADARLIIPMAQGERSLNVAAAAAMVLGEGLRQTGGFEGLVKGPS